MTNNPNRSLFRYGMDIRLNLERHCIETEIRRRYNRAVADCFKAKADMPELERRVEMLKTALETFDFPQLRRRFPELAGSGEAAVALTRRGGGPLCVTIDGAPVYPLPDQTPTPQAEDG